MGEARKILVKIVEYAGRLVEKSERCIMIEGASGGVYWITCGDGTVKIIYAEAGRK